MGMVPNDINRIDYNLTRYGKMAIPCQGITGGDFEVVGCVGALSTRLISFDPEFTIKGSRSKSSSLASR